MSRNTETFATVRVEGAILPVDLLQRVAAGDARLGGLRPEDYHLVGEKVNEATSHAWTRLSRVWEEFRPHARRQQVKDDERPSQVGKNQGPAKFQDEVQIISVKRAKPSENALVLFAAMRLAHEPCREDRHQTAR